MARRKQVTPVQRTPSSDIMEAPPDLPENSLSLANGNPKKSDLAFANGSAQKQHTTSPSSPNHPGLFELVICVGGIYATFLSWAILQERITTTPYPSQPPTLLTPNPQTERFTFSLVLNTLQSLFASMTGYLYLTFSSPRNTTIPPIFPTSAILPPLILVSITSSLASPFGYASLSHIDYLTFILAKSCKLLPVMFLHLTIFRKRYPLYKYGVVFAVTLGVAIFTLYHPTSSKKSSTKSGSSNNSLYGLTLLGINLLFDGLTNTVQDHVFTTPSRYGDFTGPQMMVAQNVLCTLLTSAYLLLTPYIPPTDLIPASASHELVEATSFMSRHPVVLYDVLGFASCGAIGQLFIFYTLARFSSLLLVTVTVTRKMLTMLLSVVWFGKSLSTGQWLGVGLVFGGIGVEAEVGRREKAAQQQQKKKGGKEL